MSANAVAIEEVEEASLEEASRRWLSENEVLPVGPTIFLRLCAANGVSVSQSMQDDLVNCVESLYARGNAFGATFKPGAPSRPKFDKLTAVGRELKNALLGIVPEHALRLRIRMVPKLLHGHNLRSVLPGQAWSELRGDLLANRGAKCEACDARPERTSDIDAHEEWDYSSSGRSGKATVSGIRLLCATCHSTVHFGLQVALVLNEKLPAAHLDAIRAHFCAVNKVGERMFDLHFKSAQEEWSAQNKRRSWIVEFGPFEGLVVKATGGVRSLKVR